MPTTTTTPETDTYDDAPEALDLTAYAYPPSGPSGTWTVEVELYDGGRFFGVYDTRVLAMPEDGETVADCIAWSVLDGAHAYAGREGIEAVALWQDAPDYLREAFENARADYLAGL